MKRGKKRDKPKRANATGSISKVGNRYVARVSVPGTKGEKRKSVSGKTWSEAHTEMVKLQAALDGKPPIEVEDLNVADFLARWLESVKPTIASSTFRNYTSVVRTHLVPTLGDMRLDALRPEAIEGLKSPERAHATTSHILLTFSMALNRALEWGLIFKNPCKGVRKPKARRKMRALSEEEVGRLLVVKPEDEAFYRVAVTLGLRKGELLALRWEDVDLKLRTLEVKASVDTHLKGERWGPTKTHERRTIIFGEKIKASLARCERNGSPLVFPCPNGKVRRAGTLDNQFRT